MTLGVYNTKKALLHTDVVIFCTIVYFSHIILYTTALNV